VGVGDTRGLEGGGPQGRFTRSQTPNDIYKLENPNSEIWKDYAGIGLPVAAVGKDCRARMRL